MKVRGALGHELQPFEGELRADLDRRHRLCERELRPVLKAEQAGN
jgi:hypothetical protein